MAEDGSPHDKNKNSPGSPPKSIKKELLKKLGWDWDAKAESYQDKIDLKVDPSKYYDLTFEEATLLWLEYPEGVSIGELQNAVNGIRSGTIGGPKLRLRFP